MTTVATVITSAVMDTVSTRSLVIPPSIIAMPAEVLSAGGGGCVPASRY
jgi:hypothetical protein